MPSEIVLGLCHIRCN